MRKPFLFLILLICFALNVKAQSWTDAEFKKADTGEFANFLTDDEKDVIFFMNLCRIDGEKFLNTYLQDYINKYNENVKPYRNYDQLKIASTHSYYKSLRSHLMNIKNLTLFFPDEKLCTASRNHAIDLKRNNLDTHESSNGETFSRRLSKYYPNTAMSENIDFGYSKGLDIVCHLLLDCGVPSLGHRYNILDQKYKFNTVGVSISTHPSFKFCTVIDFITQPMYYKNTK